VALAQLETNFIMLSRDRVEMTTTGNNAASQAFGEVCHRLVDVFLSQLFPDGLQSCFQLINRLRLLLPMWSLRASAVTLSVSNLHPSHLITNKQTVFKATNRLPGRQRSGHWEMGVVLVGWNSIILSLTTRKAAWFIISVDSVCLCVCMPVSLSVSQTITYESL